VFWPELEAVLIGYVFRIMTLYIRSDEAERLARQLAERTGRTPDQADDRAARLARIRNIQKRVAASPILEAGSDEALVYDADGLPLPSKATTSPPQT
jgi:antitoxin VapB